ncbi:MULTISPECIES: hypothetical protein [Arthrobacter]|uniref:Uncharacterized protein n=2 Tax=Arthrobacter TaxID=1663 RepID=A0ABU9KHV0_9MICC|nr:hypothetical protein [Arthrobacter sp. YJM1]MDP5226520.1 hypothetical protein [Arthrobacter sp. YJM1]
MPAWPSASGIGAALQGDTRESQQYREVRALNDRQTSEPSGVRSELATSRGGA